MSIDPKEIDILLYLIGIYNKTIKLACNCYEKAFNLINREWSINAEEYILYRGLVKYMLKLIVSVVK